MLSSPYGKVRQRHRDVPMLKERKTFLSHLERLGLSRQQLRMKASYLCRIVEVMKMESTRAVTLDEIQISAKEWAQSIERTRGPRRRSVVYFMRVAKQWFTFLGFLPSVPKPYFQNYLERYASDIRRERRITEKTAAG